jgi:hypothetical protein
MPVTQEELITFLTKLRRGAIKGVEDAPDGAVELASPDPARP